jgi:hypothetical protein
MFLRGSLQKHGIELPSTYKSGRKSNGKKEEEGREKEKRGERKKEKGEEKKRKGRQDKCINYT